MAKAPIETKETMQPITPHRARALRKRLNLQGELTLSLLPTVVVLGVFAFVEAFSQQRILFASLASSAYLIYLDPEHSTNSVRTLIISQMMAAGIGFLTYLLLGPGYLSGAIAMALVSMLMVVFDVVHPPAVATSLTFAFRSGDQSDVALFGLAVMLIATLVFLERATLWLLARFELTRK